MNNLVQLSSRKPSSTLNKNIRRPPWLRIKIKQTDTYKEVSNLLNELDLNTVCKEARCPNIWECWGEHKTATFMILGDVCTRACRYCSVTSGRPPSLPDPNEPEHVADAIVKLDLNLAVITSVDRDDLKDFGADHFVQTIHAIRRKSPCKIEVLIPDFNGDKKCLNHVLHARPEVLDHNVETVPRLYKKMRSRGIYERTLNVLKEADLFRKKNNIPMTTKTGLMVGLGETKKEIWEVLDDLRSINCDVLTVGQYLNPTKKHAPIIRFYLPDEFHEIKTIALEKGFKHVESAPLVRSSYHAHKHIPQK